MLLLNDDNARIIVQINKSFSFFRKIDFIININDMDETKLLDCIKKITFEKNKITNTKKIKKTFKIIFKNSSFFKLILLKKLKKNNEKKNRYKKIF